MRVPTSVVTTYAALALSVTLLASTPAFSQGESDTAIPHHKVLGYQDQRTGVFHLLSTVVPDAAATVAGTITVTLHITLNTTVPTGAKVICSADVFASYENPTTSASTGYTETAGAVATVSGTTATCVLSIPHSWQFPAVTATDIEGLSGTYSASIIHPGATIANIRSSSSTFVALSGNNILLTAPTAFTINVTL